MCFYVPQPPGSPAAFLCAEGKNTAELMSGRKKFQRKGRKIQLRAIVVVRSP